LLLAARGRHLPAPGRAPHRLHRPGPGGRGAYLHLRPHRCDGRARGRQLPLHPRAARDQVRRGGQVRAGAGRGRARPRGPQPG
ncbi:hypothetical protein LTR53_020327, partial [Teratosphaeriaceae sp. CCFEE 6253]